MKNLTEYLEFEDQNRNSLIQTLNQNMKSIQKQLENPHNFRRFFWTPDYNIYGFAPKDEISQTMGHWKKLEESRQIQLQKLGIMKHKPDN